MSAPGRIEVRTKVDLWSSESGPEKFKAKAQAKKSPELEAKKAAQKSLKPKKSIKAKSKP